MRSYTPTWRWVPQKGTKAWRVLERLSQSSARTKVLKQTTGCAPSVLARLYTAGHIYKEKHQNTPWSITPQGRRALERSLLRSAS